MTETAGLGRIEKAGLRNAWPHDGRRFHSLARGPCIRTGRRLGIGTRTVTRKSPDRNIFTGFAGS